MDEAEEVFGVQVPAGGNSAKAQEPCEETLDLPAAAVAAKLAAVLRGWAASSRTMGRDHLDLARCELAVEAVAIVRLVADEPFRRLFEEVLVEGVDDELAFMSLTTCNPSGERKTITVCHCHDLGRLAASSESNARAPFLAPAWEPSMYASVRSSLPRSRKSVAKPASTPCNVPSLTHVWYRRWQVWYGGYREGRSAHGAPVRRIQSTPLRTSRTGRNGRPPLEVVRCNSRSGKKPPTRSHCSSVRSTPTVDQKSLPSSIPTQKPIGYQHVTSAWL
jgi:hypothetical protein